MSENQNQKKSRSWTMLLYPDSDSLNPNYKNILSIMASHGVSIFISPLHDKDIKKDGLPVKAHRHVIIKYTYAVGYNRVKEDSKNLGFHLPPFENARVQSPLAMKLYTCHLTKECIKACKPLYKPEECIFYGDYQLEDFLEDIQKYTRGQASIAQQVAEIYQWTMNNGVFLLCDLWDYAIENKPEWLELLVKGGVCRTIVELMSSMRMKEKEIEKGTYLYR